MNKCTGFAFTLSAIPPSLPLPDHTFLHSECEMPGNVNVKPVPCFQLEEGEAWLLQLAKKAGYPQWQRK